MLSLAEWIDECVFLDAYFDEPSDQSGDPQTEEELLARLTAMTFGETIRWVGAIRGRGDFRFEEALVALTPHDLKGVGRVRPLLIAGETVGGWWETFAIAITQIDRVNRTHSAGIDLTLRDDEGRKLTVVDAWEDGDEWDEDPVPASPFRDVVSFEIDRFATKGDRQRLERDADILCRILSDIVMARPGSVMGMADRVSWLRAALTEPQQPRLGQHRLYAKPFSDRDCLEDDLIDRFAARWQPSDHAAIDELIGLYGIHWETLTESEGEHGRFGHLKSWLAEQTQDGSGFAKMPLERATPDQLRFIAWREAIRRVAAMRLGAAMPSTQARTCPICGSKFADDELDPWRVKRTGPIRYCPHCCARALGRDDYRPRPGIARAALQVVNECLGTVPTIEVCERRDVLLVANQWAQRDVLFAAFVALPTVPVLFELFGRPWTQVLYEAGIVGNHRRLSRGTLCRSSDGFWCRSLAEKVIDDWLSARRVVHGHEPCWPAHAQLNPNARLRADWELADGTYVEYAGLMGDVAYAEKMERKRRLAKAVGIRLVVVEPSDLSRLAEVFGPWTGADDLGAQPL